MHGSSACIDTIEASKENIVPLKQGRAASTLTGLLLRDKQTLNEDLQQGHASFQREIDSITLETDDPLDVYHRYIRWTLVHYPSGPCHASQLVPLLEKTTRTFIKDARYSQDIRYLRLWILYSKYIDSPIELFRFLESNNVGSALATFYEEWANLEQGLGHNSQADAIFQLGVARKAEPLVRLKKKRDAFQQKMLLTIPVETEALDGDRDHSARTALATSEIQSISQQQTVPIITSKPNGPAFAVFSDSSMTQQTSEWQELGTRDERRRENHMAATESLTSVLAKPATNVLKSLPSFSGERLQVFRDEDAPPPMHNQSPANEDIAAFNVKSIRAPSEAEALRNNPFRHYQNQVEIQAVISADPSSLAQLPATAASNQNVKPIPSKRKSEKDLKAKVSAAPARERVASPLAEVYPEDALGREEYSFEEILAIRRGLYARDGSTQESIWQNLQQQEWLVQVISSKEPFQVDADGNAVLFDENGRGKLKYIRKRQDEEAAARLERQLRLQQEQEKLESEKRAKEAQDALKRSTREPSPTIITKQAEMDIGEMFGATMAFGSPASIRSSSSHSSHTLDESVTLSEPSEEVEDDRQPPASQNEEPGDFVNDSFWGPVASQSQPWSQPSQQTTNPLLDTSDTESDPDEATPPANRDAPQSQKFQVLQDHDASASFADRSVALNSTSQQRRLVGSRFAPLVDLMSPITERTAEYRQSLANRQSMRVSIDAQTEEQSRLHSHEEESHTEFLGDRSSPSVSSKQDLLNTSYTESSSPLMSTRLAGLTLSPICPPEMQTIHESHSQEISTNMRVTEIDVIEGFPNPCRPQSEDILSRLLGEDRHSLQSIPGYHYSSTPMNKFSALKRTAKKRKSSTTNTAINPDETGLILDLAQNVSYSVREKLGEGGFGAVFRVANADPDATMDDSNTVFALKVTKPASHWEFYALHELRTRLKNDRTIHSIIQPYSLFEFPDESHFILEVADQGTLLSAVNAASTAGISPLGGSSGIDELMAIFFTIELIRVVEQLHHHQFLHADLKIDNVMVRLDEVPGGTKAWNAIYSPDGSNGWIHKGIKLIDYGRAIDLQAFPADQTFEADFEVDGRDCLAMRQGRPWREECDYYGLAGVAFTMLFGKHLEAEHTVLTPSERGLVLAGKPFKRYQQTQIWTRFFAFVLDPESASEPAAELRNIREEMETWLTANADKGGRNLKSLLRKLEIHQLSMK